MKFLNTLLVTSKIASRGSANHNNGCIAEFCSNAMASASSR